MSALMEGLEAGGVTTTTVANGESALEAVKKDAPELVVIDEGLPDFKPLDLVVKVIMTNALANTAVISSMPDKEFHDKSEGFGVLRALAGSPSREDGEELAAHLVRVLNLV
jgi:DNA-binding response OmpR family regulator